MLAANDGRIHAVAVRSLLLGSPKWAMCGERFDGSGRTGVQLMDRRCEDCLEAAEKALRTLLATR